MRRRTSPLLRATRALVGLVTIWCLGCTGYESLLDAWLGDSSVALMSCDSAMGVDIATSAGAVEAPATKSGDAAVSELANHRGFACDCGSCHAPPMNPRAVLVPRLAPVAVVHFQPPEPASISRTPLLPPPEFVA